MEHAYFIVHINKFTNTIDGAGIYSEWPLSSLGLNKETVNVCIFHKKADNYAQARNDLISELLGFPMVSSR